MTEAKDNTGAQVDAVARILSGITDEAERARFMAKVNMRAVNMAPD